MRVACALGASRDCTEEFGAECNDARVPLFGGDGGGKENCGHSVRV